MKTFNQIQQGRKLSTYVIATLLAWVGLLPNAEALAQHQTAVIPVGTPRKGETRFLVLRLAHTIRRLAYFRS
jgi:hypothetical protein